MISFLDVTEIVRVRDALHKANERQRLALVVQDAQDAICVQQLDGRILAWNPAATRVYGWTEAEALQLKPLDRFPAELRPEAISELIALSQARSLTPLRTHRLTKTGDSVAVSVTATSLTNETRQVYAVLTTERVADATPNPP